MWTWSRVARVASFGGTALVWLLARTFNRMPYSPLDNFQSINSLPSTTGTNMNHPPSAQGAVVSSLYSDGFAIAVAVVGHSTRSANISEKACRPRAVGWEPYPVPPHGGKGIHQRFRDQNTKLNNASTETRMSEMSEGGIQFNNIGWEVGTNMYGGVKTAAARDNVEAGAHLTGQMHRFQNKLTVPTPKRLNLAA
ncbi:hypothetical protein C8R43DRAFT_964532 [Mycena crocata]|nr:hypothetical protein C8R43DRAFT_964532 [Mycena crocata]